MNFPYTEKRLRVTTLGGAIQEIDSVIYSCKIKDQNGKVFEFTAHGLDTVTGNLGTSLSKEIMQQMFPNLVGGHKLSGTSPVDYLIGLGNASWQPQRVQMALGGGDFWLWQNRFGSCVGGTHPLVTSFTTRSDSLFTVLKVVTQEIYQNDDLKIPTCSTYTTKVSSADGSDFFACEQLGTYVQPKCGSCQCGRCPVPGSRYSFKEERELKLIKDNLSYDENKKCWVAKYPYVYPRESLKGNKDVAMKAMVATERTLAKKGKWGKVYEAQIKDMVDRGVVRIVPVEELKRYTGHINYLPHLAALNPRSETTPVRIVFDASRVQGGGPSLNQILAKGPDNFINILAGVILSFWNGREAAKGDVRKMYNCVQLTQEDAYVQCFLWRSLDTTREPDTYQVTVNNIGVKPAGVIAALALQNSSSMHRDKFPETARQLADESYVDDLSITAPNKQVLKTRTCKADLILKHAAMKVKKWTYSGDDLSMDVGNLVQVVAHQSPEGERMLGVLWEPVRDVFKFTVKINLSPLKNKARLGPDLSKQELLTNPPRTVTRRQFYSQVQSLFDPIGLLAPILLKAKLLLRRTWEGECTKLSWDDPLPGSLVKDMISYFVELFDLEDIEFSRSIWPKKETVGKPSLVCFSDGSELAFGTTVYIRWLLKSGSYWSSLVISKSKIGPKNRITVPRMELNGAVLAKRLREFVVSHVNLEFEEIFHLVDSSTILGYLHKEDSRLKAFEGVRVSEVQTAGKFVNGRLLNWSWVESKDNPSDWTTKPRNVKELCTEGFWQRGPLFLTQDYSTWPLKHDFRTETLEGELQLKVHHVFATDENAEELFLLLERSSTYKKVLGSVAYMLKWLSVLKSRKDESWIPGAKTAEDVKHAQVILIKMVQQDVAGELSDSVSQPNGQKVRGCFKRLAPFLDEQGIWRIGHRMKEYTPFTQDGKPPAFLPHKNRLTRLIMEHAHNMKHSGVEETVSRFRLLGFWTTQAGKLAKSVRNFCVVCRYLDKQPMKQVMGSLPKNQLISPIAWGHLEMDLFGPFSCRSDVNKRSTIKIWGMVLIDKNSGAVHADIVMDYSASETIKTLRRFAAIRGWPVKIHSDPGSQLVSSSGKLEAWWNCMGTQLANMAADSQFSWEISPSNSPWRQGRSEVRIEMLKKLITVAVGSIRLTPVELQTVLYECANLTNERPIGVNKTPKADGSFRVLTPNCLLMGRSLNTVPDDTELASHLRPSDRYQLIHHVTSAFWSRWCCEVTPEAVIRQRWHETGRNLQIGDVVWIHDSSNIKGRYLLGIVDSIDPSKDHMVRSCKVASTIPLGP